MDYRLLTLTRRKVHADSVAKILLNLSRYLEGRGTNVSYRMQIQMYVSPI